MAKLLGSRNLAEYATNECVQAVFHTTDYDGVPYSRGSSRQMSRSSSRQPSRAGERSMSPRSEPRASTAGSLNRPYSRERGAAASLSNSRSNSRNSRNRGRSSSPRGASPIPQSTEFTWGDPELAMDQLDPTEHVQSARILEMFTFGDALMNVNTALETRRPYTAPGNLLSPMWDDVEDSPLITSPWGAAPVWIVEDKDVSPLLTKRPNSVGTERTRRTSAKTNTERIVDHFPISPFGSGGPPAGGGVRKSGGRVGDGESVGSSESWSEEGGK